MVKDRPDPLDSADDWERPALAETYTLAPIRCLTTLRKLHNYRLQYEAIHGPTGKGPFTSQLPASQQEALYNENPGRYLEGLPPFAKAFYEEDAQNHAREGNLDNLPSPFIRLFVRQRGRLLGAVPLIALGSLLGRFSL